MENVCLHIFLFILIFYSLWICLVWLQGYTVIIYINVYIYICIYDNAQLTLLTPLQCVSTCHVIHLVTFMSHTLLHTCLKSD